MKYTIHEDLRSAHGISYDDAPIFSAGDIVELITAAGDSHLFIVKRTEEGEEEGGVIRNCKHCEAHKVTSCLNYWFACIGTHLKQIDTIMEDL